MIWMNVTAAAFFLIQQGAENDNADYLVRNLKPNLPIAASKGITITDIQNAGAYVPDQAVRAGTPKRVLKFVARVTDETFNSQGQTAVENFLKDVVCRQFGGGYIDMGVVTTFDYSVGARTYRQSAEQCQKIAMTAAGMKYLSLLNKENSEAASQEIENTRQARSRIQSAVRTINKAAATGQVDFIRRGERDYSKLISISVSHCDIRFNVQTRSGATRSYDYALNDVKNQNVEADTYAASAASFTGSTFVSGYPVGPDRMVVTKYLNKSTDEYEHHPKLGSYGAAIHPAWRSFVVDKRLCATFGDVN